MESRKQLETHYSLPICLLASPVYWPDADKRAGLMDEIEAAIGRDDLFEFVNIHSEEEARSAGEHLGRRPIVVVALSGGIQPWMMSLSTGRDQLAIFNAYLPEAIPTMLSGKLMHANAHPASTDFFAACRQSGRAVTWMSSVDEVRDYALAWQAVQRLAHATILKIGETEPWVINSCRDPAVVADRVGCTVVPLERDVLYDIFDSTTSEEAQVESASWLDGSSRLIEIQRDDIVKASRVTVAMRKILARHNADGLSMACFAMIGDIETTSCLALSALNDSANNIGACEGDLDAAVTLFLLKALGADFVWIANPIIHSDDKIDLVHCTAPTCACGLDLSYQLMRHHESGKGVSPGVNLPVDRVASAVRIGLNSASIVCHVGETRETPRLPACNTQIQLSVESSSLVLESLPGTHLVLSYGDYGRCMDYAADFLDFTAHITRLETKTKAAG